MKGSIKPSIKLVIILKYMVILVITIISYIGFMTSRYGAEIEEKAKNGNFQDKFLAAVHYINRDYSLDYHCPKSSIPMATVLCYKVIMLTSSQKQPINTKDRAFYWLKESLKQKETPGVLFLLSQYYLKSDIFEKNLINPVKANNEPTQQDYIQAKQLLNKANSYSLSSLSSEINYLIGWIHLHGLDGNKNVKLAKKYLLAAKELGHPLAGRVLERALINEKKD